jgi:hypothetical protein
MAACDAGDQLIFVWPAPTCQIPASRFSAMGSSHAIVSGLSPP